MKLFLTICDLCGWVVYLEVSGVWSLTFLRVCKLDLKIRGKTVIFLKLMMLHLVGSHFALASVHGFFLTLESLNQDDAEDGVGGLKIERKFGKIILDFKFLITSKFMEIYPSRRVKNSISQIKLSKKKKHSHQLIAR